MMLGYGIARSSRETAGWATLSADYYYFLGVAGE
jgi:hypothetical protein